MEMLMKKRLKKVFQVLVLSMSCLLVTSCGVPQTVSANISKFFTERSQMNKAQVERLAELGFISQEEKDSWIDSINKLVEKYTDTDSMAEGDLINLLNGMTYYDHNYQFSNNITETVYKVDANGNPTTTVDHHLAHGLTEDEWNNTYMPAILANEGNGRFLSNIKNDSTAQAIPIVESNLGSELNKRLKYPIYVLKSHTDLMGDENYMGIDGIMEMVKQATEDPNNIDEGILANYFQNSGLTLFDEDINVICDTVPKPDGMQNELGYDADIEQLDNIAFKVRLREFNMENLNKLYAVLGSGSSKYIVTKGRIYLMEYPVYRVQQASKINDNEYNLSVTQSDMYINLKTREVYRKSGSNVNKVNVSEGYYILDGAKNAEDQSRSSFVVWGSAEKLGISLNFNSGSGLSGLNNRMETIPGGYARIVLRDYLELSYAPGIVKNENLVAFGRKIRINRLRNTDDGDAVGCNLNEPFAYYIDNNGNKIDALPDILIDDVADTIGLEFENPPRVHYLARPGLTKDREGNGKAGNNEDDIKTTLTKVNELDWLNKDAITLSSQFPGNTIGKVDNGNPSRPLWYGIAVTKSFFETSLYNGWIASTDSRNSLSWWNTWLAENGYGYRIDTNIMDDWFVGNYKFELNEQGVIIIDLDTISKIQEEYDLEDDLHFTRVVRTIFILIGWALIAASILSLAAWATDVNFDVGINLLEKLSFGHWIAVKGDEELPEKNSDGTVNVTFKRMLINSIVLILVGFILIYIPATNIASKLINSVGGIAELISKFITGLGR